jgi:large subunit ribosomal protein L13
VIIVNAEKIKLTGNKLNEKEYVRHSGYPGGQRVKTPRQLLATKPTAIVEMAIRGMLPKNKLGDVLFRNLHVYTGSEHPHEAQKPKTIDLKQIK